MPAVQLLASCLGHSADVREVESGSVLLRELTSIGARHFAAPHSRDARYRRASIELPDRTRRSPALGAHRGQHAGGCCRSRRTATFDTGYPANACTNELPDHINMAISAAAAGQLASGVTPEHPLSGLTYSENPASYTDGVAITPNTPHLAAGVATSYSVSSGLPTGLTLNTTTGVITGTPSGAVAEATYTRHGASNAVSATTCRCGYYGFGNSAGTANLMAQVDFTGTIGDS